MNKCGCAAKIVTSRTDLFIKADIIDELPQVVWQQPFNIEALYSCAICHVVSFHKQNAFRFKSNENIMCMCVCIIWCFGVQYTLLRC